MLEGLVFGGPFALSGEFFMPENSAFCVKSERLVSTFDLQRNKNKHRIIQYALSNLGEGNI